MEDIYILIMNLDGETREYYEKRFVLDGYQFLICEEDILLVKKGNSNNEKECEAFLVRLVKSMVRKYSSRGLLYIDFSQEFASMMAIMKKNKNFRKVDNRIFWMIRQAITRAIIEKEKGKDWL